MTVHITTEIIFALFDLLGYRFTPRLRDLSDRRLFTSGTIDRPRYPRLQPQVTHRINRLRILEWWDDMVRVIGSMKLGWVTASLFVQKLLAYPQQNAVGSKYWNTLFLPGLRSALNRLASLHFALL